MTPSHALVKQLHDRKDHSNCLPTMFSEETKTLREKSRLCEKSRRSRKERELSRHEDLIVCMARERYWGAFYKLVRPSTAANFVFIAQEESLSERR